MSSSEKPVPLVSVCLPTYNGDRFLSDSLDSLLAQTLRDFEVIIIDDASTDGTLDIIKHYAERDSRIQYFVNESRVGLFQNHNRCVARATAPLIKLFSQDDLLAPTNLEKLAAVFAEHPNVVLASSFKYRMIERELASQQTPRFAESQYVRGMDLIKELLLGFTNIVGEPATTMYRREFVGDGFDPSFHHLGDTDCWIGLLMKGDYYHLHEKLCTYRQHCRNATTRNQKGLMLAPDFFRLGVKYSHLLAQWGVSQQQYKERATECLSSFLAMMISNGLTWEEVEQSHQESGEESISPFVEIAYFSLKQCFKTQNLLIAEQKQKEEEISRLKEELTSTLDSNCWKVTRPIRELKALCGRLNSSKAISRPAPRGVASPEIS